MKPISMQFPGLLSYPILPLKPQHPPPRGRSPTLLPKIIILNREYNTNCYKISRKQNLSIKTNSNLLHEI